jgi:putative FmdB family regulatory protein
MPIYEFVCMRCEGRFEKLLRMSDAEPPCPTCGTSEVRRQLSVFATGSRAAAGASAASGGCACGGACACGN